MKLSFKSKIYLSVGVTFLFLMTASIISSYHLILNEGERALSDKARSILSRLESVRGYVAEQGGLDQIWNKTVIEFPDGKLTPKAKSEILKQVPIFAAMKVGEEGSLEEGYSFRVFSKEARNKENQATFHESKILEKFETNPDLKEFEEITKSSVIVYRPVRLSESQGCLKCHGNPSTSPFKNNKDILGYPMENWSDGKLHGVFSITASLEKSSAASKGAVILISLISLIIGAFSLSILFLIIKNPINSLNKAVERLNASASSVKETSYNLSGRNASLEEDSSLSSQKIEEASSSIEEIFSISKSNTNFGKESSELTESAFEKVNHSKLSSNNLVSSMESITNSSKQISDIVSIIDEISFQINILSLNASIEAARAGDQGKGFSVVAKSIRDLAEKTKESSQDIKNLIQESSKNVENGTKMVLENNNNLEEIFVLMQKLKLINSEIMSSSSQQTTGIEEMSKSMNRIDENNKNNLQLVKENRKTSTDLLDQSKELSEILNEIKRVISG